ncbi:MAG: hypothetical protein H0U39_11185 [Segetibacter sp.]|nr:hypothetical protein [Segetibacter sp.]
MFRNRNNINRRKKRFFFLFFIPVLFLVFTSILMLLWNAILPAVLHVNTLTFWQAAGLLVLCRILFGGFKFWSGGTRRFGGRPSLLKDKWMKMTDEEKAKFREEWKKRCDQRRQ